MGLFDDVLIASDYDGTLANGADPIPRRVYDAVRFFREEGGLFTVSTGRVYTTFPAYDPLLINAPVLLGNGVSAYDYEAGRTLFAEELGTEAFPAIAEIAKRFPGVAVELFGYGGTARVHANAVSDAHLSRFGIIPAEADPGRLEEACRPWAKIMAVGGPEEIAGVQELLREGYPQIRFLPTKGGFLEILPANADKGKSLTRLAGILGIPMRNVIAFGDAYNDIEMLEAAAITFVPENGDEYAKARADHIVCANTEGAIADGIGILTDLARKGRFREGASC